MIEWLTTRWATMTWTEFGVGAGIFAASLAISFVAIGVVMVKIPENYFSSHYERDFLPGSPWLVRWGAVILKNFLGVILILIGIVLSLPGVPGQGILTILLGLIMLDIPGKRPLETWIIRRPAILKAINKFRARYRRSPLIVD
jgi:hypothetical protein